MHTRTHTHTHTQAGPCVENKYFFSLFGGGATQNMQPRITFPGHHKLCIPSLSSPHSDSFSLFVLFDCSFHVLTLTLPSMWYP
mmetsp:Transcript_15493/g.41971  ORF Transcript_15493/g.41971 Transcript_15493/m.41971 type:complete len:83 (-) Transcript_15493:2411-2659(-)